MMNNGRNAALSPISTDSNEWSPITRYQNINGSDNPYSPTVPANNRGVTPPTSVHTSASTTDGGMLNGMGRSAANNGNPSPPNSVGRSSDGTGLYASNMDPNLSSRKMMVLEETLSEHYRVLKAYLGPYLNDEKGNPRPSRAKDKLTRLSAVQFQELSTDVYDESLRREQDRKLGGQGAPGNDTPQFLLPKNNFHPKRNQARQKLSTLPLERFRQLATDVFYELERRFPRFTGADVPRLGSPSGSIASRASTNRGPPSRVGTPNSMRGRPPPGPPGFRAPPGPPGPGGPMGPGGPGGPGLRPGSQQSTMSASNEFGRPLPKTFQQNMIIPNKGTMVEDDDDQSDDDDGDAFDLEGAAARQSRRQTNKSLKSINVAQDKIVTDLENQVTQLQEKIESLEGTIREKDSKIQQLQDTDRNKDNMLQAKDAERADWASERSEWAAERSEWAAERSQWDNLRYSLERKVEEAEDLNSSLRSEIDKLRNENADMEQEFSAQLAQLKLDLDSKSQHQQNHTQDTEWKQRYEDLERDLREQQHIAEEVRRDAAQFLEEMKELSARSDMALEKEERLNAQVSSLQVELKEWKSRYARTKTQLRSLKASSVGLASLASPDVANYARDSSFTTPDGMVKDVHVTKFQLSIDELLQVARRLDPEQVLESMKHVVKCVRAITGDIDSTPLSQMQSPNSSINGDGNMPPEKQQAKLKARVSATANNLITASKNHASSGGLSPVSLLDAAASHLSTSVIELVKHVKVRTTSEEELQREEDDRHTPLSNKSSYSPYMPYVNGANGSGNGLGLGLGHLRHRSRGGSTDSATYSHLSSSYGGRRSDILHSIGIEKDTGMNEFKNYLDDQTALLVQSIQPLVHNIRSNPVSSAVDQQQISGFIQAISHSVQDTAAKTYEAVRDLSNPTLKKHAVPVVEALEDCRLQLLEVDITEGGRDRIPPLAFKTARAMKELVLRVERIETGELTVDQTLKNDF